MTKHTPRTSPWVERAKHLALPISDRTGSIRVEVRDPRSVICERSDCDPATCPTAAHR